VRLLALALLVAGGWQTGPPLPDARTEVAGAAFGAGVAVVAGFEEDGSSTGRVDLFRPGRGWTRLADLPVGLNHAMAAAARGRLYVVGGYGPGGPQKRAFVLEGGRWRELPPPPDARAAGGAAIVARTLYVVGGVGPGGLRRTMLALDLQRERWRVLPGATPREHLGVTALGGRVYAVGGRTAGFDTNLRLAESWAPGGRWRKLAAVPDARGGTALAAVAGTLVSAGGEAPPGTIASVYRFSPASRRWRRLADLPTPRHGLAVVGIGRTVYVIAGGPQPGLHVSDANEFLVLG
jgi:N-acetylneuraminic acid mutarotase